MIQKETVEETSKYSTVGCQETSKSFPRKCDPISSEQPSTWALPLSPTPHLYPPHSTLGKWAPSSGAPGPQATALAVALHGSLLPHPHVEVPYLDVSSKVTP